jgi:hypothetical protein
MKALRITRPLLLLFAVPFVCAMAQDRNNDSPDNQAAWRLIRRAQATSNFAVKDMIIVVDFTERNESGSVETGSYLDEASSAFGSREELRESDYLEESFLLGDENAIVGPYLRPPERIAKARPIVAEMAHAKVGAFYLADSFGPIRDTEIDGRAAECVTFDRDLPNFYGRGKDRVENGEICFDRDSGVVIRHTTNGQTWSYSDYSEFEGKLLAHKAVYEAAPNYRMEGTIQFATLGAGAQSDFQPPPGAVIIQMGPHPGLPSQ